MGQLVGLRDWRGAGGRRKVITISARRILEAILYKKRLPLLFPSSCEGITPATEFAFERCGTHSLHATGWRLHPNRAKAAPILNWRFTFRILCNNGASQFTDQSSCPYVTRIQSNWSCVQNWRSALFDLSIRIYAVSYRQIA